VPEEKQPEQKIRGGPIVPTTELDRAQKSGEAAQDARKVNKPDQKTTSADLEILSSSGKAAQERRRAQK
jgi:hypothetical protein